MAASRPRPQTPTAINHVWAYDFVFDTCADGRTLKCLTVIDEFTRECLAIDVAGGTRSGRVIEVLSQLVSVHGAPRCLRSDNGPEFVATAILRWLQAVQIETAFIDPGKPWQNGADESFNGKFRDQHLSLQWFRNRAPHQRHSPIGGWSEETRQAQGSVESRREPVRSGWDAITLEPP